MAMGPLLAQLADDERLEEVNRPRREPRANFSGVIPSRYAASPESTTSSGECAVLATHGLGNGSA